jgi:hypothetical protein
MPGQPAALARSSEVVPRRLTLENRRLPLALPQSFGRLRNAYVFASTHCGGLCRARQSKTPAPLCRSCGRCDFPVEA